MPDASAAPVEVELTITRVVEIECDEGFGVPCPDDYYARVNIANQGFEQTGYITSTDFSPNWTFNRTVDSSVGTVPIAIEMWDDDDSSANDLLDASPAGDVVDINVNLATGTWTGDVSTGISSGEHVRIYFDVEVTSALPEDPVDLTVNIARVIERVCDEGFGVPCPDDYFARVNIDGQGFQQSTHVDNPDPASIAPNWTFTRRVDRNGGPVTLDIEIWDHDSSSANDRLDASPSGDTINLVVDPLTVTWTGDVSGSVATGAVATGANVQVHFEIYIDSDGDIDDDGIPDRIELGRILADDGVTTVADMASLGADPCRKTIAVEIDYMDGAADGHTHKPKPAAIAEAVAMFDNAPVPAVTSCPYPGFPRSASGIDLLVVVDDPLPEMPALTFGPVYEAIRSTNFDPALRPYFHYALFIHSLEVGSTVSGLCCDGKDPLISLGGWTGNVGSVREQSGTFVHELGHALGFSHGGDDGVNCKANYLSTMNYSFQTIGIPDPTLPANVDIDGDGFNDVAFRLDYSRARLPLINETNLSEFTGLGMTTDGTRFSDSTGTRQWDFDGGMIDWNGDGDFNDVGVSADVNQACYDDPTPGEVHQGYNDWANITYRAVLSDGASLPNPPREQEIDFETAQEIQTELLETILPNLVVSLTATPDPALQGGPVTYRASITNVGGAAAEDINATIVMPTGLEATSCWSPSPATCTTAGTQATVRVPFLNARNSTPVVVVAAIDCSVASGTQVTTKATVTNAVTESDATDNTDELSVRITANEDCVVTPTPTCSELTVTVDLNATPPESPTNKDDVILGTPGDDIIDGLGGNDVICAGAGNDTITGGLGDDLIRGDGGNDTIDGGDGDDRLFGGADDDVINGDAGEDTLHGNRGDDTLNGGADDDRVFGYADDDILDGGDGNDKVFGHFGSDVINGGDGDDRLFGWGDGDVINGNAGDDLISGNFGDDVINGGLGNDVLYGADGDDQVNGGSGDDEVNGNSLNDIVTGGPGNDRLDGGIGRDTCDGGTGTDSSNRCESLIAIP